MSNKGVVAAGHKETARAAARILEEGGNAFDAVLAGLCSACVSEPVLASLGGGGFLLASYEGGEKHVLYDFFAQTPKTKRPVSDVDFKPILADFGEAQQEFHIGLGSMATPGIVAGLFSINRELGRMPMTRIMEPAVELAKKGVLINDFQSYLFSVVEKIYGSNETCQKAFGSTSGKEGLLVTGDTYQNRDFADFLEVLSREGEDLFYRGEIGAVIARECQGGGGYLLREDMEGYRLHHRQPLHVSYGGTDLWTNPPPSTGGILIAFALELLKGTDLSRFEFGSAGYMESLATIMKLTNEARVESGLHDADEETASNVLLNPEFLRLYRKRVEGVPRSFRGTTHISVIDATGNAASLTLSNGEGSAYIVPGTGVMINNMLGEEDINPSGFHQWPQDTRMSSMMSPSLLRHRDGTLTALGSGGSNRIRTAILQVMVNLIDYGMSMDEAVESPRMHFEGGLLSVENGLEEGEIERIGQAFPDIKQWGGRNMFFGGVHAVSIDSKRNTMTGMGDSRRGGKSIRV